MSRSGSLAILYGVLVWGITGLFMIFFDIVRVENFVVVSLFMGMIIAVVIRLTYLFD